LSPHGVVLRFEQIIYYAWRTSMMTNWVFLDESAANEFTKDRKFGW